jgi:glutathione peroxidase
MKSTPYRCALLVSLTCLPFFTMAQAAPTTTTNTTTNTANHESCPALLNHQLPRLQDEQPQSLCQYRGKVLLVVNTASYCGFTKQYQGLEQLAARYRAQGFEILGFPSNDFQQEKGSNQEIAQFCQNTYGVKFPMFAKSSVRGAQANPFYQQLITETKKTPQWNFYKYLINRQGKVIDTYSSFTAPDDRDLIKTIEHALND